MSERDFFQRLNDIRVKRESSLYRGTKNIFYPERAIQLKSPLLIQLSFIMFTSRIFFFFWPLTLLENCCSETIRHY